MRAIIPTIITQLIDDEISRVKLGNINTTRDFNYITDTADGFLNFKNKSIFGETINLKQVKKYR